MLTAEHLREVIDYDPATGIFRWRSGRALRRMKKGSVAGCASKARSNHYWLIRIDGVVHKAHRLAWLHMTGAWPAAQIDHRDTNGLNNKWENLRQATCSENAHNVPARRRNTSGFKGVCWYARDSRWKAQIAVNGRNLHVGYFDKIEEAAAAYATAAEKHHGEFARVA
jgi:hypothetical protein